MPAIEQLRQIADRMRDPARRPRAEGRQDILRLTGPEQLWVAACTEAAGLGLVDELDPQRDGLFSACIPMLLEESRTQAQVSTAILLSAHMAAVIKSGQWDQQPMASRVRQLIEATCLWSEARSALAESPHRTQWPVTIEPIPHAEVMDPAAVRYRITCDPTVDQLSERVLARVAGQGLERPTSRELLQAVDAGADWGIGPIDMLIAAFTDSTCLEKQRRQTGLKLLVDRGADGLVLLLQLQLVPWGKDEFYPDPLAMAYFASDAAFAEALATAWDGSLGLRRRSSDALSSVTWRLRALTEGDRHSPFVERVGGASAGAGTAVGLRFLLGSNRRNQAPQETWAITGRLEPNGSIKDVQGLENKLNAAFRRGLNVIVPAESADRLRSEFPGKQSQIHGAGTVSEATDLMRGAVGREVVDFASYALACIRRWLGRGAKEAAEEVVSPDALIEGDIARPPVMMIRPAPLEALALGLLLGCLAFDVWLAVGLKGWHSTAATVTFFLATLTLHRSRLRWPAVSRTAIDMGLDRLRGTMRDRLLGEHVFHVTMPATPREYKVILTAPSEPLPVAVGQRVHLWGSQVPLTRRVRCWKVEWIGADGQLGVASGPKLIPVWDVLMLLSLVILVARICASLYGMIERL